jgi:hypothetical protein
VIGQRTSAAFITKRQRPCAPSLPRRRGKVVSWVSTEQSGVDIGQSRFRFAEDDCGSSAAGTASDRHSAVTNILLAVATVVAALVAGAVALIVGNGLGMCGGGGRALRLAAATTHSREGPASLRLSPAGAPSGGAQLASRPFGRTRPCHLPTQPPLLDRRLGQVEVRGPPGPASAHRRDMHRRSPVALKERGWAWRPVVLDARWARRPSGDATGMAARPPIVGRSGSITARRTRAGAGADDAGTPSPAAVELQAARLTRGMPVLRRGGFLVPHFGLGTAEGRDPT